MTSNRKTCVVMFSGGRDSSLAAVRLYRQGYSLFLVTVTSDHLVGIPSVRRRLDEFRVHLGMKATWLHVVQPASFASTLTSQHKTCLPCHTAYSGLGVRLALDNDAGAVAFGYTIYQSSWLEQTPQGIEILRNRLRTKDLHLLLPVHDLSSRAHAINELQQAGLSPAALEQKCLAQQFNSSLEPSIATAELERWDTALAATFRLAERTRVTILQRVTL